MANKSLNSPATADIAYSQYKYQKASPYVCPYDDCGVLALHHWGHVHALTVPVSEKGAGSRPSTQNPKIVLSACQSCEREVIFIEGALAWPRASLAPPPHPEMPEVCLEDYKEAMAIASDSPRGAAALLRLSLEKLLPEIGSTSNAINDGVGELVANGVVPTRVQQALDAVRVIGNEAVHPGELDLKDDATTVGSLFSLMNFIVEKAIAEPKEIETLYAGLPDNKLKGIESRDKSTAPKAP